MYFSRRQRYEFSITGFIPAISCIALYAITVIFFGPKEGITVAGTFFILYSLFSLWIYSRTRNLSYVAAFLFQFFFGLFFLTHPKLSIIGMVNSEISGLILLICIASTVWLFYLYFKKKAKWKGREVFELASVSTEPQPDGFTGRPRPAGRTDYTKDELMGFARFFSSNLVAMPHYEDERVVLVPVKMDDAFGYLFNPGRFRKERSWIAFDFHGNVAVNISRRDYLGYKEEFSFDQLCDGLGKLFIRFMEYYRKGEAERIIYELNEVGLGLTS